MAVKKYTVNWPLKLNDKLYRQGDVIEQEEREVTSLIGGVLAEWVPNEPTNPDQKPVKNNASRPRAKAKG